MKKQLILLNCCFNSREYVVLHTTRDHMHRAENVFKVVSMLIVTIIYFGKNLWVSTLMMVRQRLGLKVNSSQ